jgi:predicted nucleic acid-binding protein
MDDTPDLVARHAHMYASAGQSDKARELLTQLEDRQKRAYVSPTFLAWVHLGLGQTNEAIARLEQAVTLRDGFLPWMTTDPYYDPIRTDPRFVELLRKIGLPP